MQNAARCQTSLASMWCTAAGAWAVLCCVGMPTAADELPDSCHLGNVLFQKSKTLVKPNQTVAVRIDPPPSYVENMTMATAGGTSERKQDQFSKFITLVTPTSYHTLSLVIVCLLVSSIVLACLLSGTIFWPKVGCETTTQTPVDSGESWLLLLAGVSVGLLVLQCCLGVAVNSLTLLADAGHTAGDAVCYSFAYFVERAKTKLCQTDGTAAGCVDAYSALLGVIAVLVPSSLAMWQAIGRLYGSVVSEADEIPETDFRDMGFALLIFSFASMVANIGVLTLRFWQQSAPPLSSVPVPSEDAQFVCVPCDPKPQTNVNSSPLKMLHMALHPGCDSTCGSASSSGVRSANDTEASPTSQNSPSLNVSGATLHLATDVIRSIIIFLAGSLIYLRVLWMTPMVADAACAVVVGVCVVVGSTVILRDVMLRLSDTLRSLLWRTFDDSALVDAGRGGTPGEVNQ
eukprot:TRINITY_DN1920_c0_g1_i1.p1 TRINITY_DN1920_c0_g1~~TRINITY_DN1920_c0_g1_i1.p1  ORF type:complete len:459 (+),score=40.58 TRINITY_DN1920_c0_g1_i1:32-1408(+)